MRIQYFPEPSKHNQYIQNSIDTVQDLFDVKVEVVPSLKHVLLKPGSLFELKRSDVLISNWLESFLSSPAGNLSAVGVFKFFAYLLYFRLISKQVVYVRHNTFPHGMKGWQARIAESIGNMGEGLCQHKVAHSKHLMGKGYAYVPHPLYKLGLDEVCLPGEEDYFIMFGRIQRYKRFESIIENWNSSRKLVLAGSIGDQEYLSELIDLAKGKSVVFDARFIPDDEAASLVCRSQGVILAHADKDMIVSGSFFFSATLGVPVFAVKKPFFEWLQNEEGYKGVFTFETPKEIVEFLETETAIDRDEIYHEARNLFGDNAIEQAWKDILIVQDKTK